MSLDLHPASRVVTLVMLTAGILVCNSPLVAGVGYCIMAVLALANPKARPMHISFLKVLIFPFAVGSLLVWPVLIGAPPGFPLGSDRVAALNFAILIVLRVAFMGSVVQALLLSLRTRELVSCLKQIGTPNDWLIVLLSSIVLVPEMRKRGDRIVVAAMSRGILRSRGIKDRFSVLVASLVPLTAWSLRSAFARSKVWIERDYFSNFSDTIKSEKRPLSVIDFVLLSFGCLWLVGNIIQRLWQ